MPSDPQSLQALANTIEQIELLISTTEPMPYYNFAGYNKSLRVTPAMEAGITDHVWDVAELLA